MRVTLAGLITETLKTVGILGGHEVAKDNEIKDGIEALKYVLDEWSAGNLMVPWKTEYVMRPGFAEVYDMEEKAFIIPNELNEAYYVRGEGGSRPLEVVTPVQMRQRAGVAGHREQGIPTMAALDGKYVLLDRVGEETEGDEIRLHFVLALEHITNFSLEKNSGADMELPPGYGTALKYALARSLFQRYRPHDQMPADLIVKGEEAEQSLRVRSLEEEVRDREEPPFVTRRRL